MPNVLTRREYLILMGSGALAASVRGVHAAGDARKPLRGAFMILNTPFTATGEVDWDDLVNETRFVDHHGVSGIVWPQGSSGVTTLTKEERLHGMTLLATTCRTLRSRVCSGCRGKTPLRCSSTRGMRNRWRPTPSSRCRRRPGNPWTTIAAYFRTLAGVTSRPVIQQTSGGARDLELPTDLIFELAREFPHLGYVKEESAPVVDRMRQELTQRSIMKGIFGASFAHGLALRDAHGPRRRHYRRVHVRRSHGTTWSLHLEGRHDEVRDLYSKYLLMRNLQEQVPGVDLYVLKKRGIFKTMYTRRGQVGGKKVAEPQLAPDVVQEIEFRLKALG